MNIDGRHLNPDGGHFDRIVYFGFISGVFLILAALMLFYLPVVQRLDLSIDLGIPWNDFYQMPRWAQVGIVGLVLVFIFGILNTMKIIFVSLNKIFSKKEKY